MMQVNERLKDLMEDRNIKAVDVVKLTGWNAAKVSRILDKKRELTGREIQQLSKLFGIQEQEFFINSRILPNSSEQEKYIDEEEAYHLSSSLKRAGEMYASADRGEFKDSDIGTLFRKELPAIISKKMNIDSRLYAVDGSIGKGTFAEVAWVAIFDRDITESATEGIYIVFLFDVAGKNVYLSFNQGYTYFGEELTPKKARVEIRKMAQILRKKIRVENSDFVDEIYLGAKKDLARGYEAGNIVGIKYSFDDMPDDNKIIRDIYDLLSAYASIKNLFSGRNVTEFYDFIVAESKGLVELEIVEKEFTTERAETIQIEETVEDVPMPKKDPVKDNNGGIRYPRDPKISAGALRSSGYKCACDESHNTFIARGTSHMYMEAHYLIPICQNAEFEYSLDVPANICSLCSVCHDKIHRGTDKDRLEMLKKLYEERKTRLTAAGIYINFEQLAKYYGIKSISD